MITVNTERLKIIALDKQSLKLSITDFNKMENLLGLTCTDENIGQREKEVFKIRLADVEHNEENYIWYTTWIVILKSKNRIIGHIMLKGYPNKNKSVTIGYYTQQPYRGYGYMSEAVIDLIKWISLNSDIEVVIADTLKSNSISQGLLKKIGMEIYKEDDECFWWKLKIK
ncbi:MAG: GNAT family N-acetyltransferase [Paraclostridium sp.]|uniref:GNAT family N-acetyltransferase n=1 Tax=Paraclostridium sp. TaxID=2023273 RepID=UPI003F3B8EA8